MHIVSSIFFLILFCIGGLFSINLLANPPKTVGFELEQDPKLQSISPQLLNTRVEAKLFEAINLFRLQKKLKSLHLEKGLRQAAIDHSRDMLKRKYLSHFSPDGENVAHRVRRHIGTRRVSLGENLHTISSRKELKDARAIAHLMLRDWIASPEHKKNIVSKKFKQTGVGCVSNGFKIYCTQVFAGPGM